MREFPVRTNGRRAWRRAIRGSLAAVCTVACAILPVLVGCSRGLDKTELDGLVDERLAERGLAPLPSGSSSATAVSSTSSSPAALQRASTDPVRASMELVARLEELMKDYKPALPLVEDRSDRFRCVTTDSAASNPDIRRAMAAAKGRVDTARKERQKAEQDFYGPLYAAAFHVDYDWATRGAKVPPVYGCWVEVRDGDEGWAKRNYLTQATCATVAARAASYGQLATGTWKIRTPEGPFIYTYSQKTEPPSAPPELMTRIEGAGFKLLARFSCRVDDVVTTADDRKSIRCASIGQSITIRVSGVVAPLNVGDVASVPLAGVRRDPDGVLFKTFAPKGDGWTVDADGTTLTVDTAATCPSIAEIMASAVDAGGSGDQK